MNELDKRLNEVLERYASSGIEQQIDYAKFYLYSLITNSTAIEGSTVTEIENQLLFDEGIAAKGRSMEEQMMNLDLRDAYSYGFEWVKNPKPYNTDILRQLAAKVMRRTGSEYSTLGGNFDSSKGDLRLCNVSAGVGGRSYLASNKVPKAMQDFCTWLNREMTTTNPTDAAAVYRLSFDAHFKLVTIHPWVDGNGRTARLLMNMIQRQLGQIPSFVPKENKKEYIEALVTTRETGDLTVIENQLLEQHILNLESRLGQYEASLKD